MVQTILSLVGLMISASLVNNVVLSQFLGLCPFLGVSRKTETAFGMGMACVFVITLASLVTNAIYKFILSPLDISFLQTIVFIMVIAMLVQFVEMFLKKFVVSLYQSLGVYLPLITTNCAVLYVALDNITQEYSLLETIVNSIGVPAGFMLMLCIFSTIRERLRGNDVPEAFQGNPIAFIIAAIMALAFSSLAGLV